MEVIDNRPPVHKGPRKRDVLVGVLVWNLVGTAAGWIAMYEGPVYGGVSIVQALGNSVATLVWCYIDAAERDFKLGPGVRLMALLLGPLALFYYLPISRGFKAGMTALGRAAVFFAVLILLTSVVNIILNLISDRMGLFAGQG
ncbi:MAG: hypothetical protein ABI791_15985 [Acidobacteriota bacterium]